TITIQTRVDNAALNGGNYSPASSPYRIRRSGGGWIPGVPSPYDSVPPLGAPGERVVKTKQAQKYPDRLEAINDDTLAGYADGGTVGNVSAPTLASSAPVVMTPTVSLAGTRVVVQIGAREFDGYIAEVADTRVAEHGIAQDRTAQYL